MPLAKLKPHEFPKVGDEENAFDSFDEDTDEDVYADELNEISEESDMNETALLYNRSAVN